MLLKGKGFHWGNVEPTFKVAYGGSGVSFSCLGNKDTVWSKTGVPLKSHYQRLNKGLDVLVVYTIFNVVYEDAGIYTCSGRGDPDNEGSDVSWSTHAELFVASKM